MFYYSVNVIWSSEDEQFVATIPELPNLTAFGDTHEEAISEAKEIAEMMIESKEEHGESIPEPKQKKSYSGQIRVRLPKSLHESIAKEADEEDTSLNQYIIYLLSMNFAAERVIKETKKAVFSPNVVFIQTPGESSENINMTPKEVPDAAYWGPENSMFWPSPQ